MIVPVAALAGTAQMQEALPQVVASSSGLSGNPANPVSYSPVYFHADEWAFLGAAVSRLIPTDNLGPGAIEAGVPVTPDKTYGIGNYAQAQFNPLREGVTETNHNIYPAMPHASYARLSDDDLAALCAYFYAG